MQLVWSNLSLWKPLRFQIDLKICCMVKLVHTLQTGRSYSEERSVNNGYSNQFGILGFPEIWITPQKMQRTILCFLSSIYLFFFSFETSSCLLAVEAPEVLC